MSQMRQNRKWPHLNGKSVLPRERTSPGLSRRFAIWLYQALSDSQPGLRNLRRRHCRRRPTPSVSLCRIRRIWRAPPRRQRHSPRHRGRARDARWCPGQPRLCAAQAQRFGLEGDHCAAGRCGPCSKAVADRGTIHSWSAWPGHTRCHANGTTRAETRQRNRSPVTRLT